MEERAIESAQELIAQHVSPDGLLTMNVQRQGSDTCLGFESFAWSTSSEFLASNWNVSPEAAVDRFLSELLTNRAIIAVAYANARIRDVWITHRPAAELKYKRHEETLEFRHWNGAAWGGPAE